VSRSPNEIREQIRGLVAEYYQAEFSPKAFVAGKSPVPVSGRVFDAEDIQSLVDSGLDFWLTTGRFANQFEKEFAAYFGVRSASLVNSGSSANLVALSALTSTKLGSRRLKPGDEVITVAAGFPTTVNPIIQNRCIPVFIDVTLPTFEVDVTQLEAALSPKTKAVMIAHTLGNPYDLDAVSAFCKKNKLWLVEDCCDAVGALYNGKKVDEQVHLGFDLAKVAHTPIPASNDGKILWAGDLGIYGNCIVIDHGFGLQSIYGHLSEIGVKVDDMVKRGQEIGKSGATGMAGGDHLHFSMQVDGVQVNPVEWWDEHWIHDRILSKLK